MDNFVISKSAYIKGLQCPKQLYLYHHSYQKKDFVTPSEQINFKRGNTIGVLAHQLFPKGKNAYSGKKYEQWFSKTKMLIDQKTEVIFEAAFKGNKAMAAVDILQKNGDKWNVWEVKSVIHVSQTHINDLAYQCFVIKMLGIEIAKAGIVHLNPNYKKQDRLNVQEFFIFTTFTEEIENKFEAIKIQFNSFIQVLNAPNIPNIEIDQHCFLPYACSFMKFCWGYKQKNEALTLGLIKGQLEILEEKKIIPSHKKEILDDVTEIKLNQDILIVIRSAVPFFNGSSAYTKIPFAIISSDGNLKILADFNAMNLNDIDHNQSFLSIHSFSHFQTILPNKKLSLEIRNTETEINEKLNTLAVEENFIIQQVLISEIEHLLFKMSESIKQEK